MSKESSIKKPHISCNPASFNYLKLHELDKMTENMSVGYINIRDAPPDYRSSSDTASVSEPLIMIPIRKEIQQVEERQNRNRSLKRNICCCSVGFVLCAIVFSIGFVVWKNYGQSLLDTETSETRCQKRIVGYYGGSNSIKVTEAQIEKLTHLIYRGIKMKPDDSKEDKDNFVFFARELRYKLESMRRTTRRQTPYIVSVYAPSYSWTAKGESLVSDLSPSVDFFNVETDNFNVPNQESEVTGPLSPLYSKNDKSIDSSMRAYACITKEPNRLNFIVPFHGVSWKNVEYPLENEEQYRTVRMKNESGDTLAWRTFKKEWDLSSASWDDKSKTPYIWNPKNRSLLTFDNERSLKEKMMYMVSKNLGGITIKSVDDDLNTLLNAMTSIDMCSGPIFKKNEVNYECE
ncbi:unnamed protein product [Caenorhabditis brenneri]